MKTRASSGTVWNAGLSPSWFEPRGRQPPRKTGHKARCGFANAFENLRFRRGPARARLAHHCSAIVGIREEHALFRGETLSQDADVRDCSRHCSDPGRVNEREHDISVKTAA